MKEKHRENGRGTREGVLEGKTTTKRLISERQRSKLYEEKNFFVNLVILVIEPKKGLKKRKSPQKLYILLSRMPTCTNPVPFSWYRRLLNSRTNFEC